MPDDTETETNIIAFPRPRVWNDERLEETRVLVTYFCRLKDSGSRSLMLRLVKRLLTKELLQDRGSDESAAVMQQVIRHTLDEGGQGDLLGD